MRIGILTYHAAHNYGSMLQAFALQSLLEQRGFNVRILNLRKSIQKKVYAQTLDIKHPKSFIYRLLKNPVDSVNCQKKWSKFERFIRENLNVTKECKDVQEVRTLISKDSYYAFVVGSDQIWNTACLDFDNSYLLPFEGNFKKVAYAPSMGPKPVFQNEDFEELFAKYLPMFDVPPRLFKFINAIFFAFSQPLSTGNTIALKSITAGYIISQIFFLNLPRQSS